MVEATLDDWLSFRSMVAFARAADQDKPSWILTYGYGLRDSAQLAGLVLAEGANFYETERPQVADSVGELFRTHLFSWIAANETELYASKSVAQVGLLYSPSNRDLINTVSGEPFDIADSVHFASYRTAAGLLYRTHIPFDVVIDTNVEAFQRYRVLIAPQLQMMSDITAAALRQFLTHCDGTLITIGETGQYDEWLNERPFPVLENVPARHFARINEINKELIELADTRLLTTTFPASVQIGVREGMKGYTIVLVNTGAKPTTEATLELRLSAPLSGNVACFSTLDGQKVDVPVVVTPEQLTIRLSIPAGIDTVALLTIPLDTQPSTQPNAERSESARHWLPLAEI